MQNKHLHVPHATAKHYPHAYQYAYPYSNAHADADADCDPFPYSNGVAASARRNCPLLNHHLYRSARQYRLFVHRLYPLPRAHPANHHRIRRQLGAVERYPRQKLYPQRRRAIRIHSGICLLSHHQPQRQWRDGNDCHRSPRRNAYLGFGIHRRNSLVSDAGSGNLGCANWSADAFGKRISG